MNTTNVTLGLSSSFLPIAMAADAIPLPPGVPWWAALLMAALGPGCVGFLHLLGKSLMLAVAAYFRARALGMKERAIKMLSDKDKSNDPEAQKLLLSAKAEEGAAEALENSANKTKG